jgi:hypothetical protein
MRNVTYNLVLKDYVPLKDAAVAMGLTYEQALSYVRKELFPSAKKIRGTRWYLHMRDIEAFLLGKIQVGGSFKK